MSRLLARLLQTIDEAPDPVSQARARLQRALYCARRGDLDGAQASADPVRQNPRLARLPALAVDLILVDAAILLFSAEPAKALDKARRAAAIAQALSDGSGVAASAAWVAWCALWLRRYDEALAHAAIALRHADDGFAHACAALVVADGCQVGGRPDLARAWTGQARRAAVGGGDELMIGAVIAHAAAAAVRAARLHRLAGTAADADADAQVDLALASALNYAAGIKSTALAWWLPSVKAQWLLAQGGVQAAGKLLAHWIPQLPGSVCPGLRQGLRADHAWCLLDGGHAADVRAQLDELEEAMPAHSDTEEQALALARLQTLAAALGESGRAAALARRAGDALTGLQAVQARLGARVAAEFDLSSQPAVRRSQP